MTRDCNLLDVPWLPVLDLAGRRRELGLLDVFRQAPSLAGLVGDTPLQQIALLRLLLAIFHRAAPVHSFEDALEHVDAFPVARAVAYLEQHRERFWLFDPERPFLQVPWLASHPRTAPELHGLAKINAEWASGNEKLLLDHHPEGAAVAVTPSAAARMLATHLQFAVGGLTKVFRTAAAGGPAMGFAHFHAAGSSLADTLTLNAIVTPRATSGNDRPPWEDPVPASEGIAAIAPPYPGPVSRFATLSRSVLLLRNPEGLVDQVHWAEGVERARDPNTLDAFEARRLARNDVWVPVQFSLEKAIWRDSHALLADALTQPAAAVAHAATVLDESGRGETLRVAVVGLVTDKAKLLAWRSESHPLPATVIRDPVRHALVRAALRTAEDAGIGLQSASRAMVAHRLRAKGDADPGTVRQTASGLPGMRLYWSRLEPGYWRFVHGLGTGESPDAALDDWAAEIQRALRAAWQVNEESLGADGRSLLAAARARGLLDSALATARHVASNA